MIFLQDPSLRLMQVIGHMIISNLSSLLIWISVLFRFSKHLLSHGERTLA